MGSPSQMIGIATYLLHRTGVPWNEALRRVTAVFENANEQVLEQANIVPITGTVAFWSAARRWG